VLLAILNSF